MRKIVFFFFYLLLNIAYSQSQNSLNLVDKYNPTPPEASIFMKVKDIPVNESTGIINPSIPLITLKVGSIELPISVSYNGNGIKVGQSPGILGYNWKLNFGGMVSRNVRDKGDEEASMEIFHDNSYYQALKRQNSSLIFRDSTDYFKALNILTFPNVDSEKDIFYYNFLGYSGAFVIEKDKSINGIKYYKGLLIKKDKEVSIRYIVERRNNNIVKEFRIILPDGTIGIFGGDKNYQVNKVRAFKNGNTVEYEDLPTSAFMLREIIEPNGEWIKFKYKSFPIYSDFLPDEKYTLSINKNVSSQERYVGLSCNVSYSASFNNYPFLEGDYILTIDEILTSIHDKIKFYYDNKTLNSIELIHYNKLVQHIDFEYLNKPEKSRNIFLKKIIFRGRLNNKEKIAPYFYEFEYDRPEEFPPVSSRKDKGYYALDYWGYYNGEVENTSLVPFQYFDSLPAALNPFATKEYKCNRKPNLKFATIGTLKKIIYPTKGFHEFEYELPFKNELKKKELHEILNITLREKTLDKKVYNNIVNNENEFNNFLRDYANDFILRSKEFELDSDCKINLKLQLNGYGNRVFGIAGTIIIDNITHDTVATLGCGIDCINCSQANNSSQHSIRSCNRNRLFYLRGGRSYTWKVLGALIENEDGYMQINSQLTYCKLDTIHEELPGLRIKRIYTKKNKNERPIIKRFYYHPVKKKRDSLIEISHAGIYFYPGVTTLTPVHYCYSMDDRLALGNWIYITPFYSDLELINSFEDEYLNCLDEISENNFCENRAARSCYPTVTKTLNLSSNSLLNFYVDDSHRRLYPVVSISIGGDDYEMGGIEKHFIAKHNNQLEKIEGKRIFLPYGTNDGWNNGTLTKEIYFNNKLKAVKQVEYYYKLNKKLQKTFYNIAVETKVTGKACYQELLSLATIYSFYGYKIYSNWISMDSIVTTEYLPSGKFVKITKNAYLNDLSGLPDEVIFRDSKGNIKKEVNYYPTLQNIEFLGLRGEERIAAIKLNKYHRYTSLLQKENYINNNLLGASKLHYKVFSDFPPYAVRIYADTLFMKKPPYDWEARQIIYKFNSRGLPQEFSIDGRNPHTFYLYGYHDTKIIAIINYVPCKFRPKGCDKETQELDIDNAIFAAIDASNKDDVEGTTQTEEDLRKALNQLRQRLINANNYYRLFAAYTYDPLIGITSKMDEKGDWEYYYYDSMNRLKLIKDKDGNIRKEYEYHYRPR